MSYLKRRESIYKPLRDEGIFTWDWMYEKEYALASIYSISQRSREELGYASEQLGKIFSKLVSAVQKMDNQLFIELGIPESIIAAARISVLPEMTTVIGRFDFAKTSKGWKMLEFNSDTPGGIVEAYYVNGKVCSYYGLQDPNFGLEDEICQAFQRIAEEYVALGYDANKMFFSSLDWHSEDSGTTHYLMNRSKLNATFVPLKDLRLYKNKLCALIERELVPIDILYRLHPLGVLSMEKDIDGFPTGASVLKLVAEGKLALINPPAAIIAQTKALQALIWNLHEIGEFFTQEEHEVIEYYMIPTYFENRFSKQSSYVVKPVLGREGGGIALYASDGTVLTYDSQDSFGEQLVIYQQLVDLENIEIETLDGMYEGYLLWGSFLLNGKASAINARVGGRITDDMSYFLPICVE